MWVPLGWKMHTRHAVVRSRGEMGTLDGKEDSLFMDANCGGAVACCIVHGGAWGGGG